MAWRDQETTLRRVPQGGAGEVGREAMKGERYVVFAVGALRAFIYVAACLITVWIRGDKSLFSDLLSMSILIELCFLAVRYERNSHQ